ncbi:hypothetical protein MMC24_002105 [Lignoscripta atroalba]|nr:hypothetical protein [Lignoscripta atroalba]
MSSNTTPISPARFAAALPALPLSSLHAKAAELRNSVAHLEKSNEELQSFADEGDGDCAEAIEENKEVVMRMNERVELLRTEVEGRGYLWQEQSQEGRKDGDGDLATGGAEADGTITERQANGHDSADSGDAGRRGGRLGDEELARRLMERIGSESDEEGTGVHL